MPVVSPFVTRRYAVTMRKAPGDRALNPQGATGAYASGFTLRKGEPGGALLADVVPTPAPGAMPVRPEQLELVAWRRAPAAGGAKGKGAPAAADSVETRDLTLERATRQGDTLRLALRLALADPPGTYAYKLALRTGGVGGFALPAWVERLSSPNPTPARDANRTLNLAKFVGDLRRAASSVVQPVVATWYVTVRKL